MYDYKTMRPALFTEDGVRILTTVRDETRRLLKQAGAVRVQEAMRPCSGDSWTILAAFDYMVEVGELLEISRAGCPGQFRVFVASSL